MYLNPIGGSPVNGVDAPRNASVDSGRPSTSQSFYRQLSVDSTNSGDILEPVEVATRPNHRALTRLSDEKFNDVMLHPLLAEGELSFARPDAERDAKVLDALANAPERIAGALPLLVGNPRLVKAAAVLAPEPAPAELVEALLATGIETFREAIAQQPELVTPDLLQKLLQGGKVFALDSALEANPAALRELERRGPVKLPVNGEPWILQASLIVLDRHSQPVRATFA